jgi:hypothetical protein
MKRNGNNHTTIPEPSLERVLDAPDIVTSVREYERLTDSRSLQLRFKQEAEREVMRADEEMSNIRARILLYGKIDGPNESTRAAQLRLACHEHEGWQIAEHKKAVSEQTYIESSAELERLDGQIQASKFYLTAITQRE